MTSTLFALKSFGQNNVKDSFLHFYNLSDRIHSPKILYEYIKNQPAFRS